MHYRFLETLSAAFSGPLLPKEADSPASKDVKLPGTDAEEPTGGDTPKGNR